MRERAAWLDHGDFAAISGQTTLNGPCKVKRILVEPGAALSLQRHVQRAEHWIAVRGVAEVTIGRRDAAAAREPVDLHPPGTVHCLGNPGRIALELVEVQTGSYLGEGDIERLDDAFGRS